MVPRTLCMGKNISRTSKSVQAIGSNVKMRASLRVFHEDSKQVILRQSGSTASLAEHSRYCDRKIFMLHAPWALLTISSNQKTRACS